jgi:hypothetical protein
VRGLEKQKDPGLTRALADGHKRAHRNRLSNGCSMANAQVIGLPILQINPEFCFPGNETMRLVLLRERIIVSWIARPRSTP